MQNKAQITNHIVSIIICKSELERHIAKKSPEWMRQKLHKKLQKLLNEITEAQIIEHRAAALELLN